MTIKLMMYCFWVHLNLLFQFQILNINPEFENNMCIFTNAVKECLTPKKGQLEHMQYFTHYYYSYYSYTNSYYIDTDSFVRFVVF